MAPVELTQSVLVVASLYTFLSYCFNTQAVTLVEEYYRQLGCSTEGPEPTFLSRLSYANVAKAVARCFVLPYPA